MFYFGVDYYPEHWPEERWAIDAGLMAEAGFNVVRLAEFAWSKMEPGEGRFDFAWLDRAITILNGHGIRVVLGTPTASPPPWLMGEHPDIYRVRPDGVRMTYGNRREYCPNNTVYRDFSRRITTAMARHYADHPGVIGWQIDNEFGDRCYCPTCAGAFQSWLKDKYTSIKVLNEKWGTVFWSHIYNEWQEIPVPATTGGSPNPGLALDFHRFVSDSYLAYQQIQIDILRANCPKHFITHNLMGFGYEQLNYFDLARPLDFVSWDSYPRDQWRMQAEVDHSVLALGHDTMRGLKRQNFWMMEQQAGQGGWEMVSVMPRPGELRLWAYQAIAHGADGVVFFRWRSARFGTEQYWHGLLDHDGTPSRRYQEIKRMGLEMRKIGTQIEATEPQPRVAMLLSYDSRFAFQVQANNPRFSYFWHFHELYQAFHGRNIPVDIVDPLSDLSVYRLVIAPALHVLSEAAAENLRRFVAGGGVTVITPRSGVKDETNQVVNQRLPGLLADLCGVQVEEYDSLPLEGANELEFCLPELADLPPIRCEIWCDVLAPVGAEVAARYCQDYYAGRAGITLHHYEKGKAIYVGSLGRAVATAVCGWAAGLAGVQPILASQQGVEVTERTNGEQRLLFLLNHSGQAKEVSFDGEFKDLLNDCPVTGRVFIPPKEVLVLADRSGS